MKKLLPLLLPCVLWVCVVGQEPSKSVKWDVLKLLNGTEYNKAELVVVEGDGIKVRHEGGVAFVPVEHLPVDLRYQFDLTQGPLIQAARQERVRKQQTDDIQRARSLAAKLRQEVDMRSLKYVIVNVKVVRVLSDGLIVYRYQPSGGVGETARAMHDLVNRPYSFRGPEQSTEAVGSGEKTLWYLQGVTGTFAEGEILVGKAAQAGVKEWQGRTLQRWIAQPRL